MERVLIVGATSAIAEATARHFAATGAVLLLAGRNGERLREVADDLTVRGAAQVATFAVDVADLDRHDALFSAVTESLGGLDAVLIAHGVLPDQASCERDVSAMARALMVNGVGTAALLTCAANYCEAQGYGCIAVLGSVAGDRGRRSNYVYGASKGMIEVFLQGLRQRLASTGVRVVTIKPGPVDTPMTEHLPRNPLFASSDYVGARVYRAMLRGKPVVYIPWFWRWIMHAVRVVPERLIRRL
jgi:short-subunit dehydrogenase